jgi:hypothetical protein
MAKKVEAAGAGSGASGAEAAAAGAASPEASLTTYTLAQISSHKTSADVWIAVNGLVYNVSTFLDNHPGGPEMILAHAGARVVRTQRRKRGASCIRGCPARARRAPLPPPRAAHTPAAPTPDSPSACSSLPFLPPRPLRPSVQARMPPLSACACAARPPAAARGRLSPAASDPPWHPRPPHPLSPHPVPARSFESIHSPSAFKMLPEYLVGKLAEGEGKRSGKGANGGRGEDSHGSPMSYVLPVLILAFAVWYQFLGGAAIIAAKRA